MYRYIILLIYLTVVICIITSEPLFLCNIDLFTFVSMHHYLLFVCFNYLSALISVYDIGLPRCPRFYTLFTSLSLFLCFIYLFVIVSMLYLPLCHCFYALFTSLSLFLCFIYLFVIVSMLYLPLSRGC